MRVTLVFVSCLFVACANGGNDSGGQPDAGRGSAADAGLEPADAATDLAETRCQDRGDDDGDGLVDCADEDCAADPRCQPGAEDCTNTFDDDGDETRDCRDSDCDGVAGCELGAEASCEDGFDNDGDLEVDCADVDCTDDPACAPESACADGADNDGDSLIDCLDDDCDGVSGCQFARETSCGDGVDNDADLDTDCDDADCAGAVACAVACPAGTTTVELDPADVPQTLPDNQAITSVVTAGAGTVARVAVAVDVTHAYTGDVRLRLESPTGTSVVLFDRHGGSGDNILGTVFLDAASVAIDAGTPPYTGMFRPDEALEGVIGEAAAGTWTLHASDESGGIAGNLDDWQLVMCVCTDCEVGAACLDGNDNDGDLLTDCADPDCAGVVQCIPESVCDDGLDSDLDGLTDCADDDCDAVGACEFGAEVSCEDGADNDGDDAVDCADSDCAADVYCTGEVDCHDGVDNDGDSYLDCLDPGCASDATCEPAGEVTCDDGVDNDSDGQVDCADSECAGTVLCANPCPTGSSAHVVRGAGLPRTITDAGAITSVVSTGGGIVTRAAVAVDVSHAYVGDVRLQLESPHGTEVVLFDRHGGSGDNLVGTVFLDDAGTPIASGTPPYTGSFQPDQALSALLGEDAAGDWTLHASDEDSGVTGTLAAWELVVCVCTDCEVGAACNDELDNDGDTYFDCDDPDCAGALQCIPETACDDGLDNDLDELVDCEDDQCDGVGICEFAIELSCDDGLDNDADGDADCADTDCVADVYCTGEIDCHDGLDNDGDGVHDCQDPGCWIDPTCQPAGETLCGDGVDNDSDGVTDCDEPGCALACAESACAPSEVLVGAVAAGLPLATADNTTVVASIPLAVPGTVTRTVVGLSVTHTFAADLDMFLVSPAATSITLSTDNGGSGDNYRSTVFSDDAATAITAGTAPFTGRFRPQTALAGVSGQSASGRWDLRVGDDASGDGGSLDEFSLALCVAP